MGLLCQPRILLHLWIRIARSTYWGGGMRHTVCATDIFDWPDSIDWLISAMNQSTLSWDGITRWQACCLSMIDSTWHPRVVSGHAIAIDHEPIALSLTNAEVHPDTYSRHQRSISKQKSWYRSWLARRTGEKVVRGEARVTPHDLAKHLTSSDYTY